MINEVYASGETVALAKEKACNMLGVSEDRVEFEILQFPSKKVLGMFGGKMAQVRAVLKQSVAEKAVKFLKEMFFYMNMESLNVSIEKEEPDFCYLKITGDDVKYILGKHGDILDSIQYIIGLVANNKNKNFCKIRLEAGDYREKRVQTLERLGKSIAEKVLKTGRKFSLEPMKSYERKIIHDSVGKVEGVKSWSEGEGKKRHVVISQSKNVK